MKTAMARTLLALLLLAAPLLAGGCSYLRDRGNDALDIFDIGFTVTDKLTPDFAVYLDFFGRTPLGGAYLDHAKLLGIGYRHVGWLDYESKSWGALAWGSEKYGSGEFDPKNPYQAREDQQNLTERPRFHTGFARMIAEDNAPPPIQFFACDKAVHLGYVGFLANCRPLELIDFLLGWTTLDILCDDGAAYRGEAAKD